MSNKLYKDIVEKMLAMSATPHSQMAHMLLAEARNRARDATTKLGPSEIHCIVSDLCKDCEKLSELASELANIDADLALVQEYDKVDDDLHESKEVENIMIQMEKMRVVVELLTYKIISMQDHQGHIQKQ
jgi:hypothetical protein